MTNYLSSAEIHPNDSSLLHFTRNLPEWTVGAELGSHLWNDTNSTDDPCYPNDADSRMCVERPIALHPSCLRKSGTRKKCSVCRITCHTTCLSKIQVPCRPTYRDVDIHELETETFNARYTTHHWVHRRRLESKCRKCSKSIRPKFPFTSKEFVAVQCTWCKASYHNKASCYPYDKLNQACSLGTHRALIIPPHWILKLFAKDACQPGAIQQTTSQLPTAYPPSVLATGSSSTKPSIQNPIDVVGQTNAAPANGSLETQSMTDPLSSLPFRVVPNPTEVDSHRPLLVFLNPKSGGNQAASLLRKFQWLLNPRQIFDLSQTGPSLGLELFHRVPNLRILVCGGDGTVGWLLSTLDELRLSSPPPVAVLPLGTGNDLARTLRWGSGYVDESISNVLHSVQNAEVIALDRWRVDCHIRDTWCLPVNDDEEAGGSDSEVDRQTDARPTLPWKVFNNYFSIGADAATALDFHESREANPEKFNSRLKNKMFYAGRGGKDLILRNWRGLVDHITLKCDGKDLTPLIRTLRPHVILFLNIPRYGAGTQPWGHTPDNAGLQPQQINDGLIEVVGLSAMSLAILQLGGHGDRICQCRRITLTTDSVIPMQMDGEACRLLPAVVKVRCAKPALMLQRKHAKMPKGMVRLPR